MKTNSRIKMLLLALSVMTFTQCVMVKPIESDKTLVMKFHYDKVSGISLVDSKILEEAFISNKKNEAKFANNKLEIIFKKGTSIKINHPLYTYVEYVNKDFSFSTTEVKLDEADFEIKYPFLPDYSEIEIKEILKNERPETIFRFKLNN